MALNRISLSCERLFISETGVLSSESSTAKKFSEIMQSITGAKEQTCAWLYCSAVATQLGTADMIYFDCNRIWDTHNRAIFTSR